MLDAQLSIEKYFVADLEEPDDLSCPWITSFEALANQRRMTPISRSILNLRDTIFSRRGIYALTVGQFVNFWSYYDGFLRQTEASALGDKVVFRCKWRGCPAKYYFTLIEPQQIIVIQTSQDEHYHSIMDSVHQLPMSTLVRYQVLDIITRNNYPSTSVVIQDLNDIDVELRLRAGLDRVDMEYIEELMSMLAGKRSGQSHEESQRKRIRLINN